MSNPDAQTPSRAHQLFAKAVRALQPRRNAPPPTIFITAPTPTPPPIMPWETVELSSYPPQLTRADVTALFQGFTIAPDYDLPNVRNLAYPLRTFINVAGENEAAAAARELCGRLVGGRKISVKMVKKSSHQEKDATVQDAADEFKIGIINAARMYYPHLANKFLEVREVIQGTPNFAFLQAREPVTVHSEPEVHRQPLKNEAEWQLVAAGRSDCWAWKTNGGNERLAALKELSDTVERQGQMRRFWGQWEVNKVLDVTRGC